MTYVIIGSVLLAVAIIVRLVAEVVARRRGTPIPLLPTLVTALVLIVLTAIFDTVMIGVGLVDYAESQIWGPRIGLAPIEDFTYPIALAILFPGVWALVARREES